MRGEKQRALLVLEYAQGSPPRARGKVHENLRAGRDAGITPACAGKSIGSGLSRTHGRDHPRVRGEKIDKGVRIDETRGSPPRARGKAQEGICIVNCAGITPACAGKSAIWCIFRRITRDHPRVRGEKKNLVSDFRIGLGSPPRARGKEQVQSEDSLRFGITPACAGKSVDFVDGEIVLRDHPRVRGEKHLARREPGGHAGITPACAGKSMRSPWTTWCARDHPRVRGEKVMRDDLRAARQGSPPRARGKEQHEHESFVRAGITPACAGKSWPLPAQVRFYRDHPRVRGEKCPALGWGAAGAGSPPRARGKD